MIDLSGQHVVITGAGGGIGQALVAAFARAGAVITTCDQTELATGGAIIAHHRFNLTDPDGAAAAARAIARAGVPDIIINNAGWTRAELMTTMTPVDMAHEVQLNLTGVMQFTHGLLPALREAGHGSIVFVSSVNAGLHYGNPAYSAAKAGIEAYARAIAVEDGRHGIRANCVRPGSTRTHAWDHRLAADPALLPRVARLSPLGRMVTPDEVAHAVLFLASPLASGITGAVLPVDVGQTAGNMGFLSTVLQAQS